MFHDKYPRLVVYRSNRHFEVQIINDFEAIPSSLLPLKMLLLKRKLQVLKIRQRYQLLLEKLLRKKPQTKKLKK